MPAMALLNALSSPISRKYPDASYLIQRKALALYYFILSTIFILLVMIGVFLFLQPVSFLRSVIAISTLISLELVAFVLLVRGRYGISANFIVAATALLLAAAQFAKLSRDPHTGYTSFFYLMLVIVVLAALFCSRRWLFGVTVFFIGSDVIFFFLVRDKLDELGLQAATVGVVDSVFTFTFVMVLHFSSWRLPRGRSGDRTRRRWRTGRTTGRFSRCSSRLRIPHAFWPDPRER